MKKLLLLAGITGGYFLPAQAQGPKLYQIKPGEAYSDKIPASEIFHYPAFKTGRVHFKNNETGDGMLNYNALAGEIQFIDPKGDTLSLAEPETIRMVTIQADTFYYSDGYLQTMASHNKQVLARKAGFRLVKSERVGAFDQAMPSGSQTVAFVNLGGRRADLIARETLTLERFNEFYIGDRFRKFTPLNRKSLLKRYSDHTRDIEAYLQAQPVVFYNEADVLRLFSFLSGLK